MKIGDTIVFHFNTFNPSLGNVWDADFLPICEIFEGSNETPKLSLIATKVSGLVGSYLVAIAATIGNGFVVGRSYSVIVSAIVMGVQSRKILASFILDSKRIGDLSIDTAAIEGKLDDKTTGLVALKTLINILEAKLNAVAHSFQEQADVPFNINATLVEANILDLSAINTRYIIRNLRLKCVDPVEQTVTVRLYELVNTVLVLVDSFNITTANFVTAHSLMDMFGLSQLVGDNLKVTVIATAVGPYACVGQYSFAMAT